MVLRAFSSHAVDLPHITINSANVEILIQDPTPAHIQAYFPCVRVHDNSKRSINCAQSTGLCFKLRKLKYSPEPLLMHSKALLEQQDVVEHFGSVCDIHLSICLGLSCTM